jgi:hypothetical protein
METTNSKNTKADSTSSIKMFNDNLMDIYKKQVDASFNLYNSFNASVGNAKTLWEPLKGFNNLFLSQGWEKNMMMPYQMEGMNNTFNKLLSEALEKVAQQASDLNRSLIEQNEKLQKNIENSFYSTKKVVNSLLENYYTTLDFSLKSNMELIEKINNEINEMVKRSSELWPDEPKISASKNNHEYKARHEEHPSQEKKHAKTHA